MSYSQKIIAVTNELERIEKQQQELKKQQLEIKKQQLELKKQEEEFSMILILLNKQLEEANIKKQQQELKKQQQQELKKQQQEQEELKKQQQEQEPQVSYKKTKITATTKRLVWNKWIGEEIGKSKCLCCKVTYITQMSFNCGHIIAEVNGGETNVSNLRPICQNCNSSMGITNMDDFMKTLM